MSTATPALVELTKPPAFCDPTSVPKLPRVIPALIRSLPNDITSRRPLTHISPNVLELEVMYSLLSDPAENVEDAAFAYIDSLNLGADWRAKLEVFTNRPERQWIRTEGVVQHMVTCLPYVESFWLKASHRGVIHLHITPTPPPPMETDSFSQQLPAPHEGYLAVTHYPAMRMPEEEIVSTTGAGDTLVGAVIAGLISGGDERIWMGNALEGVARTMRSRRAVG